MLEHRWLMSPGKRDHVHHINLDPLDNRPENLAVLTPSEHRKAHSKVTDEMLTELHRRGLNASEIGREVGLSSPQAFRRLRALGLDTTRGKFWNKTEVDVDAVKRLVVDGLRAEAIAERLGCPVGSVRRVLKTEGLRLPSGRPPK